VQVLSAATAATPRRPAISESANLISLAEDETQCSAGSGGWRLPFALAGNFDQHSRRHASVGDERALADICRVRRACALDSA
jgi:hypothetical protein